MTLVNTMSKPRSAPIAWMIWAGSTAYLALNWVLRRGTAKNKVLTRAQEKQRRKELVREHRRNKTR
ncbi:MAG TPA: hypothetical protein VIM11_27555 [Tepidisphaeraceae bacterium]